MNEQEFVTFILLMIRVIYYRKDSQAGMNKFVISTLTEKLGML
jgi:hypothetical protein